MNIILISKYSKTRSFKVDKFFFLVMALVIALFLIAGVVVLQTAIVHFTPEWAEKDLRNWLETTQMKDQKKQEARRRASLDAMGETLGKMQAQIQRLDALGGHLVQAVGVTKTDFKFSPPTPNELKNPPQGGSYIPVPKNFSSEDLRQQIKDVSLVINDRYDKMLTLQNILLEDQNTARLYPSGSPVKTGWFSSNFGWRQDPFTGKVSKHEGVDYAVPMDTPVYAAAGGVVDYAGPHPDYGFLVEIDHGNGLTTRYGHNTSVLVEVGQIVRRGQKIALSGSTGRSTGPHVHFEVRKNGVAVSPLLFLSKESAPKSTPFKGRGMASASD